MKNSSRKLYKDSWISYTLFMQSAYAYFLLGREREQVSQKIFTKRAGSSGEPPPGEEGVGNMRKNWNSIGWKVSRGGGLLGILLLVVAQAAFGIGTGTGFCTPLWPQSLHDAEHTSRSAILGAQIGTVSWTAQLSGESEAHPVVNCDGTIFAVVELEDDTSGGEGGALIALSRTGTVLWKYVLSGETESPPGINPAGTVVYLGTEEEGSSSPETGALYAINTDGTLSWKLPLPYEIESPMTIAADGTIYVGGETHQTVNGVTREMGVLTAVSPAGAVLWSTQLTGELEHSSPAIAPDGTLWVGSEIEGSNPAGNLYTLSPSGQLLRTLALGEIESSAVIDSRGCPGNNPSTCYVVYVVTEVGNLISLDPNGHVNWSLALGGGEAEAAPALAADGTLYTITESGKLTAVNPDGTIKWTATVPGGLDMDEASPVVDAEGNVYVVGETPGTPHETSGLFAFTASGHLLWSSTGIVGESEASPVIGADGLILVVTEEPGYLYAVGGAVLLP